MNLTETDFKPFNASQFLTKVGKPRVNEISLAVYLNKEDVKRVTDQFYHANLIDQSKIASMILLYTYAGNNVRSRFKKCIAKYET